MTTNRLLSSLEERFSPLIFSERQLNLQDIETLLQAATTAPSSYNAQPWRFIYGVKNSETYSKLFSTLSDYNQKWAVTAPLLMLSIAQVRDLNKSEDNYYAFHDVGMAVASMTIQAVSMGIQFHQMGGYDMGKTAKIFQLTEGFVPVAIIAVGFPGDTNKLKGHFLERATAQKSRKSISEISGDIGFFIGE